MYRSFPTVFLLGVVGCGPSYLVSNSDLEYAKTLRPSSVALRGMDPDNPARPIGYLRLDLIEVDEPGMIEGTKLVSVPGKGLRNSGAALFGVGLGLGIVGIGLGAYLGSACTSSSHYNPYEHECRFLAGVGGGVPGGIGAGMLIIGSGLLLGSIGKASAIVKPGQADMVYLPPISATEPPKTRPPSVE